MRVVFLGTPTFAAESLRAIAKKHDVVAVVTQPDRPANRGKIFPTPVKQCAEELGIDVFQFEKISSAGCDTLRSLNSDVMITVAYGQILSQEVIDIPKHGIFNVHASLLPKYRGSSPIQWAIINGEKQTGVTIMRTNIGLDTGDMILQQVIDIECDDNAATLFDKLSSLGADAICDALDLLDNGGITFTVQDEGSATYYPMLKKEDGRIDWTCSAVAIRNKVRGMCSWPVASTTLAGKGVKIYGCEVVSCDNDGKCGEITVENKSIIVRCGIDALRINELQLEGKRKMSAVDFINGTRLHGGEILI